MIWFNTWPEIEFEMAQSFKLISLALKGLLLRLRIVIMGLVSSKTRVRRDPNL